MGAIHVCPVNLLARTVEQAGASRLVTLLTAGTQFERPAAIAEANHLALSMNDIVKERDGLMPPARQHVEALLDFVHAWDRSAPLVISCFAGISRSTAAAYVCAAALSPGRDEAELALALRRLSPSATPNLLLVRHGDAVLGRNGRMVAAIEAIGRGADAFEGAPFHLRMEA